MYGQFERDRHRIDPSRYFEVRYEDLVRDPIGQMRALYDQLSLGEFELARPKLEAYFKDREDFRTGTYQLLGELRDEIDRRWGPYMRRHGYCRPEEATNRG
jgi:hypothetical protein